MKSRLYLASAVILAIGLAAAAMIYVTAEDAPGGSTYTIPPDSSKMYIRELRRFGGKASVLFADFNEWFAGLWQGKSLGVTIAWISVFASLGVVLVARNLPPSRNGGD